jgi:hypothetical protein
VEAEATWVAAAVVVTANLFSLLKLERPVCFGRRAFFLLLLCYRFAQESFPSCASSTSFRAILSAASGCACVRAASDIA